MGEENKIKFSNLKEMLKISGEIYENRPAFYLDGTDLESSKIMTHGEFRKNVDYLGTALIEMGLKNKKIAVISENRYEWEEAYLAVVCGTGIVVPLDKALPELEIESSIIRSEVEAIFYSDKYSEIMARIQKKGNTKIKYFISMDLEKSDFNKYSQSEIIKKGKELVEAGNKDFIEAKISNDEMSIMLFTSGTTNMSKIVMLSHKNICTNLYDITTCYDINSADRMLSFLPLHHTFECTVGFLYPISVGSAIVFSKGIRHIGDEMKNFKITAMISVPVMMEKIYEKIMKSIEKKRKIKYCAKRCKNI